MSKLLQKLMEEVQDDGAELPGGPELQEAEPSVDRWGEFLSDDDEVEEQGEEEPAPAETSDEPTPPEQEEAPAEPVTPAQEQPQAPAPISAEQIQEARGKLEASLTSHYALSEEDALLLQMEPEKVIPQMAAKLHLEVLDHVRSLMNSVVPSIVESYTQSTVRNTKAKDEFFSAFPELANYEDQVIEIGTMFRKLNPKASPEEAIKRIGETTMAALGLTRRQSGSEAPTAPAARPFQPAAPGRVASPPASKNKWEALMEDDD